MPGSTPCPRLNTCPSRPPARRSTANAFASTASHGARHAAGSRFPCTPTSNPTRSHASCNGTRQSTPITLAPASRISVSSSPVPTPKWISGTPASASPSKISRITGSTKLSSTRYLPAWKKSLSDERESPHGMSVLEGVILASVLLAGLAMAIWFFIAAGSPLPNQ